MALTTNGVLLKPALSERLLAEASWIKVSIDAGTARTYAAVHGTKAADFDTVLHNLEAAATLRVRHGYACTLGAQALLLPENAAEMALLAQTCRDLGLDYLVIKPYSQHPQGISHDYSAVQYQEFMGLGARLEQLATPTFRPIFRFQTMQRHDAALRRYERCLALPFWSYVDASGDVWGCSVFLGKETFHYGSLYENTFSEIWQGQQRKQSLKWCSENLDTTACRISCRMDDINAYLMESPRKGRYGKAPCLPPGWV